MSPSYKEAVMVHAITSRSKLAREAAIEQRDYMVARSYDPQVIKNVLDRIEEADTLSREAAELFSEGEPYFIFSLLNALDAYRGIKVAVYQFGPSP
jgi:hypothetical protein